MRLMLFQPIERWACIPNASPPSECPLCMTALPFVTGSKFRVPDALQHEVLRRRAGTVAVTAFAAIPVCSAPFLAAQRPGKRGLNVSHASINVGTNSCRFQSVEKCHG
jgi:hypothetical protein